MMKRKAKVISLKAIAEEEFMSILDVRLKNTVWGTENCGSWYANKRGDITLLWSDNCISYWWQTRNINWSQFDFVQGMSRKKKHDKKSCQK